MLVKTIGRSTRRIANRFRREQRGAIAVEVALVGPLLVMSVLGLAETSVHVSDQQRLQAGAVAGAQYLHDVVARDEGTKLNPIWVSSESGGSWQDGNAMTAARAIIRDASSLELDTRDIDIAFDCGCLEMTPIAMNEGSALEDVTPTSPSQPDVTYGLASKGVSVRKDGTCKTSCADGSAAHMLATITIDYATTRLRGGEVVRDHTLTLRLG